MAVACGGSSKRGADEAEENAPVAGASSGSASGGTSAVRSQDGAGGGSVGGSSTSPGGATGGAQATEGGTAGSGGASPETSVRNSLGADCDLPGSLGCSDGSLRLVLVCAADGTWDSLETCDAGLVCDARPGAGMGACAEVDVRCASAAAFCDGADAYVCNDAGLAVFAETCDTVCVDGACVVDYGSADNALLLQPFPADYCVGRPDGERICRTPLDVAECEDDQVGGHLERCASNYAVCSYGECVDRMSGSTEWGNRCSVEDECAGMVEIDPAGERVVSVPVVGVGDRLWIRVQIGTLGSSCDHGLTYEHCVIVRVPTAAYVAVQARVAAVNTVVRPGAIPTSDECLPYGVEYPLTEDEQVRCVRANEAADYRVCSDGPTDGPVDVYIEAEHYSSVTDSWLVAAPDDCVTAVLP